MHKCNVAQLLTSNLLASGTSGVGSAGVPCAAPWAAFCDLGLSSNAGRDETLSFESGTKLRSASYSLSSLTRLVVNNVLFTIIT